MALLFADVLLGLVVENNDLFALALLKHLALSGHALDNGLANYDFISAKHQHFECDISANLNIQLFNENFVAGLNFVLLAAGTDDSVHVLYLLL